VKDFPAIDKTLVVRTDFSSDAGWQAVCAAMAKQLGEPDFGDTIECLSDPDYDGLTVEQLVGYSSGGGDALTDVFLVDDVAISQPDYPVLAVDLYEEPGRTFRVVASELWTVGANLSIANMDFSEFADGVGEDGIFRGY
jgi:hypothetical protein